MHRFVSAALVASALNIAAAACVAPAARAETSSTNGRAKVVVPVDGMSGDDAWPELYTAWHLANAARIGPQVTLTRMDIVTLE